jgi:hypothetical protein
MPYSYYTELNDPVEAFLKRNGKFPNSVSTAFSSTKASQMSHTLLWRQEPEESFSDWKIELEPDNVMVNNEICSSLSENPVEVAKEDAPADDDINKGDDSNISDDGSIRIMSMEGAPITSFHVHRSILASVSKYFRSQFSKHTNTKEQQTFTSILKLHSNVMEVFPVFLDYMYNYDVGRLNFRRSNAVALRQLCNIFWSGRSTKGYYRAYPTRFP